MSLTGIKLRAYPTSEQGETLSQWLGCARFIYNAKCDDDQYFRMFLYKSLSLTGDKVPVDQTYAQYKTELTPWLDNCPAIILRNSTVNWYQAYQRYFQGLSGRPTRKKKGSHSSMYRYQDNLATPQAPLDILTQLASEGKAALGEVVTGLDRGVIIPRQASTGASFDFTAQQKAAIKRRQRRIKKQSRRLARQHKGSRRRAQTKHKVAKTHQAIANTRKDFAHKTSRTLVDSNAQVFIAEDLILVNMTAKPKAKQDKQGRYLPNSASAKAGLNAALLNAALGSMILFLAYKAQRINKVVIKLPPHCSSQECVKCNHTHSDNR